MEPPLSKNKTTGAFRLPLERVVMSKLQEMHEALKPATDNDGFKITQREYYALINAFRHIHVNNGVDDACRQCGLDLRNPVHMRANS